ncbi:MAG: OadG family protein [Bacteroidales bacterium]|nr:OadG family protein [Bacteroidales bacterium]
MNFALFIPLVVAQNVTAAGAAEVMDDVDVFVQNDPYGGIMALLGMSIVFSALLLLYIIFSNTPVLFTFSFKQRLKKALTFKKKEEIIIETPAQKQEELSGEVNAAIAAAIHLYRSELHDFEDTILTIKKVSRTYSPWSSKIYGLRKPLSN